MVWEGGGFAKRCYWSLYSWNNLYGLATAASSLINVCQKPGSGLPGVKALRNNASHHQREWQKRRNEKEDWGEVGRRGRRQHESRVVEAKKTERLSQTFEIHKGDRSHGSRRKKRSENRAEWSCERVMMCTAGEGVSRSVESCIQSTEIVYMNPRPE